MALPVASYLVVSNVSEHKTWSAQYCALRTPIPLAGFPTPDSGVRRLLSTPSVMRGNLSSSNRAGFFVKSKQISADIPPKELRGRKNRSRPSARPS